MNTGIGDAINLAWKLAAVVAGRAPDALLDSYEAERIGFARRLVATTDRAFTFATGQGRLAAFVRTHLAPMVHAGAVQFRRGAQSSHSARSRRPMINYRGSPLSHGAAGRVQAATGCPGSQTDGV